MRPITLALLAHGWAAIRCGDQTPISTGHMKAAIMLFSDSPIKRNMNSMIWLVKKSTMPSASKISLISVVISR